MGDTYTRQSSSTIVDGTTIEATHFNSEFDQLVAAFAVSSGHTHDGTTAEGGPVTKLLGNTLTFGAATAGTDITVTFDGESNDGVLKWMEDEDYFEFSDDILVGSNERLNFRDTALYIHSSADGQLDIVADTELQIAATTVDINGNVDISGTLTVAGAVDFGDAALSNVGAVQLDSIAGDGDTNTSITFSGSDVITIATGGAGRLTIGDGALSPVTNNQIDLGTASLEFKDGYFDGTVTADAFAGPLTGNVTGNVSGTAATVTGAAQSNITSLGTLTTLTVDNVITNGATIGHTSDTDLITLADGVVTVAGELDAATLDISGNADIDGTLEADAITVNGTALATVIAGTTVTNATNSAHVLVTDNENTNEENLIAFVEGATSSTGNVGLEMDGNFAYNPSTGTVSSTIFKGNIDAVDGDFDGTLEADAITLNGTAITATATLATGISNNNVPKFTSGVADDDFLRVNGTAIEGRSASEVLSDIGASAAAGSSSIVTTGALDTGSITSGFGNIDNGASNITNGGLVKLDVDSDADDVTGDSATGRLTIGTGEDLNLYHGGTE